MALRKFLQGKIEGRRPRGVITMAGPKRILHYKQISVRQKTVNGGRPLSPTVYSHNVTILFRHEEKKKMR